MARDGELHCATVIVTNSTPWFDVLLAFEDCQEKARNAQMLQSLVRTPSSAIKVATNRRRSEDITVRPTLHSSPFNTRLRRLTAEVNPTSSSLL